MGYVQAMATVLTRTLEMLPEVAERLHAVAALADGDAVAIALEGIQRYLDDLEDIRIAEERLRDYVPGTGIPIEQLIAEYGLGD